MSAIAMEVRPGYKPSKAGVIPEDWQEARLSDVVQIVGGGTPNTQVAEYWNGSISWVSAGDVSQAQGRYVASTEKTITEIGLASCPARVLPEGTVVIIARGATVGRMAQLGGPMAFNQTCYGLVPARDLLDQDYLYYAMMKSISSMASLTYGTIFGTITTSSFESWYIPLPPLPEQRAIAAALGDVDALLAALERLIAKRRAVKQAAMDALLSGRVRLVESGEWTADSSAPSSAHRPLSTVRYKLTEVGEIPEDWEVRRVQEIAQVKTGPFGSALHERDYVDDGTPIITVEHIGEFGIAGESIPMVSETDKKRLSAYELKEHDIVFSRVGAIDRNALIQSNEAGWLFSGRLLRVRPDPDKVYAPYLSYHFHTRAFKERVKSVAVGQTMPSLNTQILNSLLVVIPPLPEQRAIAGVLSDMDAAILALERQRAKVQAIKQGMMQDLLTGRVRLV